MKRLWIQFLTIKLLQSINKKVFSEKNSSVALVWLFGSYFFLALVHRFQLLVTVSSYFCFFGAIYILVGSFSVLIRFFNKTEWAKLRVSSQSDLAAKRKFCSKIFVTLLILIYSSIIPIFAGSKISFVLVICIYAATILLTLLILILYKTYRSRVFLDVVGVIVMPFYSIMVVSLISLFNQECAVFVNAHILYLVVLFNFTLNLLDVLLKPPYLLEKAKLSITWTGATMAVLSTLISSQTDNLIEYFVQVSHISVGNQESAISALFAHTFQLGILLLYTVNTFVAGIVSELRISSAKAKAKRYYTELIDVMDKKCQLDNITFIKSIIVNIMYLSPERYEQIIIYNSELRRIYKDVMNDVFLPNQDFWVRINKWLKLLF